MKGAVIVNGIVLSLTLAPRPQVGHTHVDDVGDEADDDDGDDDDNDGDADDADHVWGGNMCIASCWPHTCW